MTRGVKDGVLQDKALASDGETLSAPAAWLVGTCQIVQHRRLMSAERRVVALCAGSYLRSWIEAEVSDLVGARVYALTVEDALAALGRGGASRAELLLLDLDMVGATEVRDIQAGLEMKWWNGMIIGLGSARGLHRRYLEIEHVIARPFGSEALRAIVERVDPDRQETQPMIGGVADIERRR